MLAAAAGQIGGVFSIPATAPDGPVRTPPDPTPVVFPSCAPQAEDNPPRPSSSRAHSPLVALLQTIQRPADLQLSHFEALGLHVISNASPQDVLPDAGYLPPVDQWTSIAPEDLEAATLASKKPLSNGNLSPGLQTYLERRNELSIDNTAAFRTVRRIPPPAGETAVRLGNAYEFFKNLELFSGYWIDTSLPPEPEPEPGASNTSGSESPSQTEDKKDETPPHLRTHHRTGTGSQLPPDYRQHLLTAFIKLVAYDFGCNASFPRVEPRLHLTPPPPSTLPPSYFNCGNSFIYRTPRDRASARIGVVEGPLAAVSCRTTTVFATEVDEKLDLAREIVAVLLTAQQRAREGKEEKRSGEGKWWTTAPRWGGGPGGAIGKEADKPSPPTDESLTTKLASSIGGEKLDPALAAATSAMSSVATQALKIPERLGVVDVKRIGGISPASLPSKKSKRTGMKNGNLPIYENYRKMLPPSSNWDRKARYEPIGKVAGAGCDDIFLVSALNHHISLIRVRVPDKLLQVLGGEIVESVENGRDWGRVTAWRTRWFDLFLKDDRIEGMGLVWGMMSWLMRAVDDPAPPKESEPKAEDDSEKMDTS